MTGGGSGGGALPPAGSPPGIVGTTPVYPPNRLILAQLIEEEPHHRALLRSPHGDRVILPAARRADGLLVFLVAEGSQWLLTVSGSDVVDLPISAGQGVTIVLP